MRFLCLALLAFPHFHCVPSVQSGEPAPPIPELSKGSVAAAAATAAMHHPAGALSIILAGETLNSWEPPATQKVASPMDQAPVIDPDLLAGVEDKAEVKGAAENYNEAWAYSYLLVQANTTPVAAFAKSARRDLTFAHLFEEPRKYRGQVVHIEGRLKRLRRFDAPRMAAKQGVPVIYEGWIFGDAYGSNPYCVIVTAMPDSIPLGETLEQRVSFDGYFFKRYRYKAGDGWRDTPLLIGHALSAREIPNTSPDADSSFAGLLLLLIAIVGATVLLVLCLNWWFRRSDQRVRTSLDRTRNGSFVEPEPNGSSTV
jgi:hypothetical protein